MIPRRTLAARWAGGLAGALLVALGVGGPARAQGTDTDYGIRFFQSRVSRDPLDVFGYVKLGEAYIQKARETGDITYYELAEKALTRSVELSPDASSAASATTQLALLAYTRHQFRDAIALAEKAVALGAARLGPYAVLGDAYVELGRYEEAWTAYSRMLGLRGPLYPHARLSHLRFLRGEAEAAIQEMQRGVEALLGANVPKENLAWSQVQVGGLFFQVGHLGKAEASYREALATYPGYHRALAGLARVRAAQQGYDDAIELYRKALGVIPLPEYAAALGDVYTKLGRAGEARRQYDLVEYIGQLNALNKAVYNRELALFYADHDLKLPLALELAERELEVRRDIYTYDVLAWALYKNGKLREAQAAMAEALKLGTRDARLLFHAGMIYRGVGDTQRAREHLQRALMTNRHFDLLQTEVAARTAKDLETRPGQP